MSFAPHTLAAIAPLSTSVPSVGSASVYDLVRKDLRKDVHVLRSSILDSHKGPLPRKAPLRLWLWGDLYFSVYCTPRVIVL